MSDFLHQNVLAMFICSSLISLHAPEKVQVHLIAQSSADRTDLCADPITSTEKAANLCLAAAHTQSEKSIFLPWLLSMQK